ncbi:MAG: hypothetical protein QOE23_232 [Pseudonocardiales bacterium]|jgi:hypothetical protein|nr:hypothetical protein [Pseudonocardiales bacterium]
MSDGPLLSTVNGAAGGRRGTAGLRHRIAERRQLARLDRAAAQLAELHLVRTVLGGAAGVVAAGWIQDGWFAYRDDQGRQQVVTAHDLHRIAGRQPTAACLVGAIVQAGGGLPAAHSQPVHRALNLAWQALFGSTEPVEYCPAPGLRVARVRELTAWNDRPNRTASEVHAVLVAAGRRAADQPKSNELTCAGSSATTVLVRR